ncbi:nuclear transport factor 2 family protein [Synechococcus sp. BIOS-E4-1]|uniref:nuclear transport factor 2 family protein n=1 Tax=Synechococcus sp. BIOS-E4-1 TaxID=1400864 RepID=UPI001647E59C|nr:hypothetical protein [Synechococcus sp. BIOS-E4-1]
MQLTRDYVDKAIHLLEVGAIDEFLANYVAENVQWVITGSSVLGGIYSSRTHFINTAISRLKSSLDGDIQWIVKNVIIDGSVAVLEMTSKAVSKQGQPYNNQYVWILEFNGIVFDKVRVYFDDVLVNKIIK